MTNNWEKLVKEAEMVAIFGHKGIAYDIFPYEKHLRDVVEILREFGFINEYECAAWLHDGIEDTYLTYSKIKKGFGIDVAELVLSVTDPIDVRNRKEKKAIVYKKLQAYRKGIPLKLADRIANTRHSLRFDNRDKIKMYLEEYPDFKTNVYLKDEDDRVEKMWKCLEELYSVKKNGVVA